MILVGFGKVLFNLVENFNTKICDTKKMFWKHYFLPQSSYETAAAVITQPMQKRYLTVPSEANVLLKMSIDEFFFLRIYLK